MPEFDDRLPRKESIYPFSEAGVVYSPNVLVRCGRDGRPNASQDQRMVAVVSSAAQDLRDWKPHYKGPFDRRLTTEKLRSHLWAAANHGHTALVLGAFGCGAFKNDANELTRLYMELLGAGGEFEGRFGVVVFAIIKSNHLLERFSVAFPWMHQLPAPRNGGGKGKRKNYVSTDEVTSRSLLVENSSMVGEALNSTAAPSRLSSEEKEVLKLAKKLREIRELEQCSVEGKAISQNQQTKIDSKQDCLSKMQEALSCVPSNSDVRSKVKDLGDLSNLSTLL